MNLTEVCMNVNETTLFQQIVQLHFNGFRVALE